MSTKAQLFGEFFNDASNKEVTTNRVAVLEKRKRWKAYLDGVPADAGALQMLASLDKDLSKLNNSTKNIANLSKVQRLSFIKDVIVEDDKVILETENVEFKWREKNVDIGNYFITFSKYSRRPTVTRKQGHIRTAGGTVRDRFVHHPVIADSGNICWGNSNKVENMVNLAVKDKRPEVVATIIWNILKNPFNGSGWVTGQTFMSVIVNPLPTRMSEVQKRNRRAREAWNDLKIVRFVSYLKRTIRLRTRLRQIILASP